MYRLKVSPAADRDLERLKRRIRRHDFERLRTAVRELAKRMARLAHRLRDLVTTAFQKELNLPSLSNLYKAFCDTLVPDLTTEQFADMYAQTIAYGLFAARCNCSNGTTFTRQYARDLVPKLRNFADASPAASRPGGRGQSRANRCRCAA